MTFNPWIIGIGLVVHPLCFVFQVLLTGQRLRGGEYGRAAFSAFFAIFSLVWIIIFLESK